MADFLEPAFRAAGADEVTRDELAPNRPNVYAIFRGVGGGEVAKWIGLDIHTDTVAIAGMAPHSPWSGTVTTDGRLHGRGACDTKATLAVVLSLLQEDGGRQRLRHNLVVAGTVGEETGRLGAGGFNRFLQRRGLALDELIVAEPTQCVPIYAHKGHVRLRFDIEGTPAHSSQPHLGKNAITAAAELILAFRRRHEELQRRESDDPGVNPLGPATLTPTLLSGGTGINIVPGVASVSVDRRVVGGESAAAVRDALAAFGRDVCEKSQHCVGVTVGPAQRDPVGDAFVQDATGSLVQSLAKWSGEAPAVATYGTNAGLPYGADVAKAVCVFGPGSIAQAHQNDEWIELSQLAKHKGVLKQWLFDA